MTEPDATQLDVATIQKEYTFDAMLQRLFDSVHSKRDTLADIIRRNLEQRDSKATSVCQVLPLEKDGQFPKEVFKEIGDAIFTVIADENNWHLTFRYNYDDHVMTWYFDSDVEGAEEVDHAHVLAHNRFIKT